MYTAVKKIYRNKRISFICVDETKASEKFYDVAQMQVFLRV